MAVLAGRALLGLKPLSNKTWNAVFRGEVELQSGEIVRGFIKDLDPRQLANEMLVAVLGARLGMKVPRGAIVAVSSEVSTDFKQLPHSNGTDFVAFCSVDAGGSTVAQIVSTADGHANLSALKSSPGLGSMYGLDTWVANIDRHMNNIILSGDGSAYLIDHGHCFSGPAWSTNDLKATVAYENRLARWLTPQLSEEERTRAMADVSKLVARMASTDVQLAVNDALVEQLCGSIDCDALVGFLEGRVEHVPTMSAQSLDVLV